MTDYVFSIRDSNTMRKWIRPIAKCTRETLKGIDKALIPQDSLDTLYLCYSILNTGHNTYIKLNMVEIRMVYKLLNGCQFCYKYTNCNNVDDKPEIKRRRNELSDYLQELILKEDFYNE